MLTLPKNCKQLLNRGVFTFDKTGAIIKVKILEIYFRYKAVPQLVGYAHVPDTLEFLCNRGTTSKLYKADQLYLSKKEAKEDQEDILLTKLAAAKKALVCCRQRVTRITKELVEVEKQKDQIVNQLAAIERRKQCQQ